MFICIEVEQLAQRNVELEQELKILEDEPVYINTCFSDQDHA